MSWNSSQSLERIMSKVNWPKILGYRCICCGCSMEDEVEYLQKEGIYCNIICVDCYEAGPCDGCKYDKFPDGVNHEKWLLELECVQKGRCLKK